MRRYTAPKKEFEGLIIKPHEYLIEDFGDHFEVHRVISVENVQDHSQRDVMVATSGDYIIPRMAICNTIEEAEAVIESYWNGTKKLNFLIEKIEAKKKK